MDFSYALNALKEGAKVARAGWNGKGMFIYLVPGSIFTVNRPPLLGIYPAGTVVTYHPHIDMKTADDMLVPWLCSQTDMLADDWGIVGRDGLADPELMAAPWGSQPGMVPEPSAAEKRAYFDGFVLDSAPRCPAPLVDALPFVLDRKVGSRP